MVHDNGAIHHFYSVLRMKLMLALIYLFRLSAMSAEAGGFVPRRRYVKHSVSLVVYISIIDRNTINEV